jgi:hypothetical protein
MGGAECQAEPRFAFKLPKQPGNGRSLAPSRSPRTRNAGQFADKRLARSSVRSVDDLRLFDRALSADEVKLLFGEQP